MFKETPMKAPAKVLGILLSGGKRLLLWPIAICLYLLFTGHMAIADFIIESEQVISGIPGVPDGVQEMKTYVASEGYRTETSGRVIIVDLASMSLYILNPENKTFTRSSLNDHTAELPMTPELGETGKAELKATAETKVISGYSCLKYTVDPSVGDDAEYWISENVPEPLKVMMKKTTPSTAFNTAGYPVRVRKKVLGGVILHTVKKIEETDALDKALLTVPQDYRLQ